MSPHLRSMLEDAADDADRPATIDLNEIRSAGRRTIWRRRGFVAAGGVAVAAVVTSVALLAPSLGNPGDDAASGPDTSSEPDTMLDAEALGLNPFLDPLLTALQNAGYRVGTFNGGGTIGMSESSSGSAAGGGTSDESGAAESSITMTGIDISRGESVGSVSIAEFTDARMLSQSIAVDELETDVPAEQCAVLPIGASTADLSWSGCDKDPSGDAEIWRATGSGSAVEAVGVTFVRADGTGLSITVSTRTYQTVGFGYEELPTTAPAAPALDELPMGVEALASIVAAIGASGSVFPAQELTDPPMTFDACPEGDVLAEMSDDGGRSTLVASDMGTFVCTTGAGAESPLDVMDVTGWPAFDGEFEAWHFNLGHLSSCSSIGGCGDDVRVGVGAVPEGVARITFQTADGDVLDAEIADGSWLFRYVETIAEPGVAPPLIVRAYDADGLLLVEGDVNDPDLGPLPDIEVSAPPPPPVP